MGATQPATRVVSVLILAPMFFYPRQSLISPPTAHYANCMNILVNGESRKTASDSTLATLVAELSLAEKRLAIEVNEEVVPRSYYERFCLSEGDKVEIVHAIGGG